MHRDRPIGIFDSGVGGLTVVKAIRQLLPYENLIYIGDTKRVPYGIRSPAAITQFATEVARKLLRYKPKALVIACNTVSAVCFSEIRSLAGKIPVVGVIIPTVEYALTQSKRKKIAIIATEATINSNIYEKTITAFNPGFRVISIAAPLLVPMIEENPRNHPLIKVIIEQYLHPIKENQLVDTVILGCTHYPLIKKQIAAYLGKNSIVIDSAEPTANALKKMLTYNRMLQPQQKPLQIFFTSDDPAKSMTIAREFLGEDLILKQISL